MLDIMDQPVIGFITCVHPFYALPEIAAVSWQAIGELESAGCNVVATGILRTSQDAVDAASDLKQKSIDLAVLFFCTWVREDIGLSLAHELPDVPMLLWALPFLDEKVPMPSPMSGLVATASNLRRVGKRFTYQVGGVVPGLIEKTARAARVGAVLRALKRSRFGVIGQPCPGMIDVEIKNEELVRALGATAIEFDFENFLKMVDSASPERAAAAAQRLMTAAGGVREIDAQRLADNLRIYVSLKEIVADNKLDGYCMRCWPEMRDQRGITPCASHALLAEDGIANTCEVDLPALVTTYILARLAGSAAFNFDITGYLEAGDAVQMAHCGAAAPALAEDPSTVSLRTHMRTGSGATVEFPFKQGPVTLAKLLRPTDGKFTLFAASGRVVASEGVRGSVATVRPDPSAAAFLDLIVREGVEHHIALVYGSWVDDLRLLCEFAGLRCVTPAVSSGR
jgi:L-fucose isomerase-like protein